VLFAHPFEDATRPNKATLIFPSRQRTRSLDLVICTCLAGRFNSLLLEIDHLIDLVPELFPGKLGAVGQRGLWRRSKLL